MPVWSFADYIAPFPVRSREDLDGPLHVAATTCVPIVGLYGPTLPIRSAPWRDPRYATESVDAGELPCRPCDQRVCAPGDFRCLTSIEAARVFEAARRALAASRGA